MALKLPPKGAAPTKTTVKAPPKTPEKKEAPRKTENGQGALSPEDTVEYGITMEVSPKAGQKAWIKLGVTSSVRAKETTEDAEERIFNYVESRLDKRLEELS